MNNLPIFNTFFAVRILAFFFPLAVVSVRHWSSVIFGLMAALSLGLVFLRKLGSSRLYKEEKLLLWLFGGYFSVALFTILLRGWDKAGEYALGTEVRFLLLIPIYLVVRRCEDIWKYLWIGSLVGVFLAVTYGVYEFYIQGLPRVSGVYGPLLYGPVLLLMVALQLPWTRMGSRPGKLRYSIWVVSVAGIYIVFLSGARSAYVALIVAVVMSFIYYFGDKRSVLVFVASCIVLVVAYAGNDVVHERGTTAFDETKSYIAYM